MCSWKVVNGVQVKTDCRRTDCTHSDSYVPPADRPTK